MAERSLLRVLTVEAGVPFRQFVQDYEDNAKELAKERSDPRIASATVSEPTYRRWTGGQVVKLPLHPAPLILERMYGYAARILFGPADAVPPPTPVSVLDESESAMTARDAAAHASNAASLSVSDITLDQLKDDVIALARTYHSTSPGDAHRHGEELQRLAQTLLDRTQRPRQRHDLYLAAGEASAIMSVAAFDLGFFGPSVQLARTAALYGEVIEDGPLQAYATGLLAYIAFWENRPTEAVRLAGSAMERYGGLGATAITRLSAIQARAYAHLGDRDSAEGALAKSLEPGNSDRDELHDDIGGEFGFHAARLAMSNATSYLLLGDSDHAEQSATHALQLLADTPESARSIVISCKASADLARARLLRGELAGAAEALNPVFDVGSEWRGTGITERLLTTRKHLTQPAFRDASEARELGERIEDFTANAVSRGLGGSAHLAIEG
ncbi:hypothetical protein ACFP1Z_11865 [Streptomyces gamaensis]|uniref:Transcriptional regulator n=1 Tax=Streptomyces gamaensis TaxID=1763542 RepID=A0ABW0YZL3_9ACTN